MTPEEFLDAFDKAPLEERVALLIRARRHLKAWSEDEKFVVLNYMKRLRDLLLKLSEVNDTN